MAKRSLAIDVSVGFLGTLRQLTRAPAAVRSMWVIVILFGTTGGCRKVDESGPVLVVDRAVHEFAVEATTEASTHFELSNQGRKALKIEKIETSCGCTAAKPETDSLLPGEATALRVQMSRPPIGKQEATITIWTDSARTPQVSLKLICPAGNDESRVMRIVPKRLDLDARSSQPVESVVTITTLERASGRFVSTLECDLPFLQVGSPQIIDHPTTSAEFVQREYQFPIRTEECPAGRFYGSISTQTPRVPSAGRPFRIPVEYAGAAGAFSEPEALFAALRSGERFPEWSVEVKAASKDINFEIESLQSDAEWLSARLADVPADRGDGNREPRRSQNLVIRVSSEPAVTPARGIVSLQFRNSVPSKLEIPVLVLGVVSAE